MDSHSTPTSSPGPTKASALPRVRRRRLRRIGVITALALVLLGIAFCSRHYPSWSRQATIRRMGGTVKVGAPKIYSDVVYSNRTPGIVRTLFTSKAGYWIFSKFGPVYEIDLRGIRNAQSFETTFDACNEFEDVTTLVLYQTAVSDEHLARLPKMFPKVTHLKCNETNITDAGIVYLPQLTELLALNAQRTLVTNACVPDLAAIRKLRELNIGETEVTLTQPIRDALPRCFINDQVATSHRTNDWYRVHGRSL